MVFFAAYDVTFFYLNVFCFFQTFDYHQLSSDVYRPPKFGVIVMFDNAKNQMKTSRSNSEAF